MTLKMVTEQELFATIKFFILSLLILPFLPDQKFGPEGIINLRDIGWVVVIVSVISFIGYFLTKFIGTRKGIIATAILGGLISSTSVAWTFSARSKENPALANTYASGILIASAIMFPRLGHRFLYFQPCNSPNFVVAFFAHVHYSGFLFMVVGP
jgi:uncharacterized membrane protein (DUF4010 family)